MHENIFINPEEILDQIELEKGTTAVDFGSGNGYFSIPLAKRIGDEGMVFSLDVLPSALEAVESKKSSEGLTNIQTRRVNLEKEAGSGLNAETVDLIVIKDMLYQNKDHSTILAEANRILKAGGRALIIEWEKGKNTIGPPDDLRIDKQQILSITKESGFSLIKEIEAGDFHFAFLFKK